MVRLAVALSRVSGAIAFGSLPGIAQEVENREWGMGNGEEQSALTPNSQLLTPDFLSELDQPATTVEEWVAQMEASIVQVTAVRVEATEAGLQVILETTEGSLDVPETRSVGNALIADIPNAAIAEEFSQANPIEGVALVSVTSLPGDRVRIAITGTDAPPVAEVTSEAQGLAFAVTVSEAGTAADEDAIQVVVTGEQDEGYNPSRATTATRTDTPLRDIPASIQVVPRQVLEDRNVRTVNEAVETVAGVVDNGDNDGYAGDRIIRGFSQGFGSAPANLRNGYRDVVYYALTPIGTIEQIEVLRGPASVLFGALEPGGVINVITRQPLNEPFYELGFDIGNYGFYQPSIDVSGPITEDETLLYRFIASYQSRDSIQEFANAERVTVAPSITLNLGDRTSVNLYYEYTDLFLDPIQSYGFVLSDSSLTPRDLFIGYPEYHILDIVTQRFGYTLEHEFNDNWRIRNGFATALTDTLEVRNLAVTGIVDDRFVQFDFYEGSQLIDVYSGQAELIGEFNTGSISHQLLVGFDFYRLVDHLDIDFTADVPDQDLLNPAYDIPELSTDPFVRNRNSTQSFGIYLQDQIRLSDNFIVLLGGRYDWVSSERQSNGVDQPIQNDGAFSPRIGVVYQPSETVSLYASHSRSFQQTTGFDVENTPFSPSRGTQYEIGLRAEFLEGRLSTNLAAYHLTKTNITTPDLDNPNFSVQTGEARSQGIELDVTGEILPGWNVILSYAYTDAEVTEDNTTPVGNQLVGVPENQASLWTTYTIQEGDLEGLGFGLGLFYVGERQTDLANTFQLDDYLRTDAAIYYRRGRLNVAINIRNLFNVDPGVNGFDASTGFGTVFNRIAPFTIVGSVSWEF
jgi:iron complex outermembrane receptor protein